MQDRKPGNKPFRHQYCQLYHLPWHGVDLLSKAREEEEVISLQYISVSFILYTAES